MFEYYAKFPHLLSPSEAKYEGEALWAKVEGTEPAVVEELNLFQKFSQSLSQSAWRLFTTRW
jgi:hypothetical protein